MRDATEPRGQYGVQCATVKIAELRETPRFERYATRVEEYRLPKGEAARTALGERIGADGHTILVAVYAPSAPAWLRELPAVQTLRRAWVHQFHLEDDVVRWRKAADLPPAGTRFDSPYDTDARYGNKRSTAAQPGPATRFT
jgi:transposase